MNTSITHQVINMDYSNYQFNILCEDKRQYDFIRGWLEERGAGRRRICSTGGLPHSGSGKAFVLEQYPSALKKHKKQSASVRTILIIMIDADNDRSDNCYRSFKEADDIDTVFLLFPKWSIETWFRFIQGVDYSEKKSYKYQDKELYNKPTRMGKQLVRLLSSDSINSPESLSIACKKIREKEQRLQT